MGDVSNQRLPSLDGFRAASVLLVIGAHAKLPWFSGVLGVRCFFVISGFLITRLLLSEQARFGGISLTNFYARRALRILPVYFAFLAALAILTKLTALDISTCQYATAFTFTKNIGPAGCGGWIDGHLWSLCVEEQFYLLWPLLLARCRLRTALLVALLAICLAPLSRVVEYKAGHNADAFFWLSSNADALMIGALVAIASLKRKTETLRLLHWHPTAFRLAALIAVLLPAALSENLLLGWFTVTLGPLVQAMAIAYLVSSYSLAGTGAVYVVLNNRATVYLGVLSYSLYIWQQPFFATPETFGIAHSALLQSPIRELAILALAALSYHGLEKPLLGLRGTFRTRSLALRDAGDGLQIGVQR